MEFKTKPFAHQLSEVENHWRDTSRAILWEQGTGKTKPTIDTMARWWEARGIDGVLIAAPNGVHRNWVEQEIPAHLPDCVLEQSRVLCYQTSKASTIRHKKAVDDLLRFEGLAWMTASYDAFITKAGHAAISQFIKKRRVAFVLDEAQYVKNPDADRTKEVLRYAKHVVVRRVLTGTPIAQGPFDLYSQFKFMDEEFWVKHGFGSFTEFKKHFGVWGLIWNPNAFNPNTRRRDGNHVEILKSYHHLEELAEIIKSISSRVTKDQVLDLPPKLYSKRYFSMTDEQAKHYRGLKEEFMTWIALHPEELSLFSGGMDGQTVATLLDSGGVVPKCEVCGGSREVVMEGMVYPCDKCPPSTPLVGGDTLVAAPLAMVRLLRLQQVTCGYLPTDLDEEPVYQIPGANRRLSALLDICEEAEHKVIVWARFQLDITLILEALRERGIKAVRYDGLTSEEERARAKALFTGKRPVYEGGQFVRNEDVPEEEQAKIFVGNPAAGATGLTLVVAKTVVYYNNSFKLLDRLQSEDRAHRIGQDNSVIYIDLVAEDTVDEKIVEALRKKKNIADVILGDVSKEWL